MDIRRVSGHITSLWETEKQWCHLVIVTHIFGHTMYNERVHNECRGGEEKKKGAHSIVDRYVWKVTIHKPPFNSKLLYNWILRKKITVTRLVPNVEDNTSPLQTELKRCSQTPQSALKDATHCFILHLILNKIRGHLELGWILWIQNQRLQETIPCETKRSLSALPPLHYTYITRIHDWHHDGTDDSWCAWQSCRNHGSPSVHWNRA